MKTFVYVFLIITIADIITIAGYAFYKSYVKKNNKPEPRTMSNVFRTLYSNCNLYTITTAIFIAATTVLALAGFSMIHDKVVSNICPYNAPWHPKDTVNLKSGPEWFYYDQKAATVNALHPVSEKDKSVLIDLINKPSKDFNSYSLAIDQLAYKSNIDNGNTGYCWILLLYCMTGVIGVQLRTINNFLGVACFKTNFDFGVWWPWYSMRPLIGFITGGVVFLLIDGKFIYSNQALSGLNPVVIALAFIGGFSADDFYIMLRRISQRIFSSNQTQSIPQADNNKDAGKDGKGKANN